MKHPNPEDVQIVPPGLHVQVHRHNIDTAAGPAPCFSYVTQNLSELGQQELRLTLLRQTDDDARGLIRPVLELLKIIYEQAQAGQFVTSGGFTQLGAAGLFGKGFIGGALYVTAQAIQGVETDSSTLAILLLTPAETALTQAFGGWRVLGRLAQTSGFHPYPPYNLRERGCLAMANEQDASFLAQVPTLFVGATSAHLEGGKIVLQLNHQSRTSLEQALDQLPPHAPLALLCAPQPELPAGLVWRPGQENPAAFTAPGADASILGGGFCAFVPQQPSVAGQLLEDGFALSLDDGSWLRLRQALGTGNDIALHAASDEALGFILRWSDS